MTRRPPVQMHPKRQRDDTESQLFATSNDATITDIRSRHLPLPPVDRVLFLQSPPPSSDEAPAILEEAPYRERAIDFLSDEEQRGKRQIVYRPAGHSAPIVVIDSV